MILIRLIRSAFLCLMVQFNVSLLAQDQVKGVILDYNTKIPIPYVNIGIENTSIGGASYEDGTFDIDIPEQFKTDSLVFSAIGYKKINVAIEGLQSLDTVLMDEQITSLDEVVIISNRDKSPVFVDGLIKPNYGLLGMWWDGVYISDTNGGSAVAILLNNESKHIYLKSAEVFIHNNRLNRFDLRLRILNVEQGKPFDDLILKNILVSSGKEKGRLQIDLSVYSIFLNEPFFLVFEWIVSRDNSNNLRKKKKVDRAITALSVRETEDYIGFRRKSSMSGWERTEYVVVGNVTYSIVD